jgi:hypothetical protein
MTCVGRLAAEKNLEAFLGLRRAGTKVLIGDRPQRAALAARYPDAVFLGYRCGVELALLLGAPDVLEFSEPHGHLRPRDDRGARRRGCGGGLAGARIRGCHRAGLTGVRRADLGEAIRGALRLNRHVCAARVGTFSREAATSQFLAGLAPIPLPLRARVAVSRSSAMIERRAARRHTTSQAGDAN